MNTNMTGLRWFLKTLCNCALDESSLSIGKVKHACLKGSIVLRRASASCKIDITSGSVALK